MLPADGLSTASVTATVFDRAGAPIQGQRVRILVEGDDNQFGANPYGALNGGEVVTGTTDSVGRFVTTFSAGVHIEGTATLRAELLRGSTAVAAAQAQIELDDRWPLFLPAIRR